MILCWQRGSGSIVNTRAAFLCELAGRPHRRSMWAAHLRCAPSWGRKRKSERDRLPAVRFSVSASATAASQSVSAHGSHDRTRVHTCRYLVHGEHDQSSLRPLNRQATWRRRTATKRSNGICKGADGKNTCVVTAAKRTRSNTATACQTDGMHRAGLCSQRRRAEVQHAGLGRRRLRMKTVPCMCLARAV